MYVYIDFICLQQTGEVKTKTKLMVFSNKIFNEISLIVDGSTVEVKVEEIEKDLNYILSEAARIFYEEYEKK